MADSVVKAVAREASWQERLANFEKHALNIVEEFGVMDHPAASSLGSLLTKIMQNYHEVRYFGPIAKQGSPSEALIFSPSPSRVGSTDTIYTGPSGQFLDSMKIPEKDVAKG